MWEHYKKTFWPTQIAIAALVLATLVVTRLWSVAATFLFATEIGAVLGAGWAANLKTRILRRQARWLMR